ncbi:MAG TPA: ATP-binding cassette domain-containing protein [Micromonosporaceae bacterium]
MSKAIEARGLTRRFGEVEAVSNLDLDVGTGEVFAFLGPNGAGKTTTVRMLVTLLKPTSGSATVAGYDVVTQAGQVRRAIGVTLQELSLDPMMTATELVALHLSLHGLGRDKEAAERGKELIAELGLTEAAERRVMTYSVGMRRRLDLALALIHRPQVLFLDEPTTGLDPSSRLVIWDRIRELHAAGTTVFLTTQYLEEADQLADRVSIIDQGRIVAEGAPEALKTEVGKPRLDLRVESGPADVDSILSGYGQVVRGGGDLVSVSLADEQSDVTAIIKALADAGATVRSLDLVRPSLEDVFIAKTGRRLEGAGKDADQLSVIAGG